MHLLEAISEDWTVCFVKNIASDVNGVIGSNADNETVESGMVKFTQSNVVGNVGLAFRVAIGNYMGSVKEFVVP